MNMAKTMNTKDLFFLEIVIKEDLKLMELNKSLKEEFKLLKT